MTMVQPATERRAEPAWRWRMAGEGDDDGGDNEGPPRRGNNQTGVITRTRTRTKKPSMYKVLMLNDDYTPMEFVVHVLERFFGKAHEEAVRIMLHVHQRGVGVCGVFTYEVAETKVTQVIDFARRHQHPLQCTLEKD
ncbi:MAG: ATP-dependent Clp protease adapter ClpS [Alphaproteobacteria bacterium]